MVHNTIFRKRFWVPGFGTGSGTLEPVPWNRFLRQFTSLGAVRLPETEVGVKVNNNNKVNGSGLIWRYNIIVYCNMTLLFSRHQKRYRTH